MAKIEDSIDIIKFLTEKFGLTISELKHRIEFISDSPADEDPDWTIAEAVKGLNAKGIMTSDLLNSWELVSLMVKGDYLHEDYRPEFGQKVLDAVCGKGSDSGSEGGPKTGKGNTLIVMDRATAEKPGFDLSNLKQDGLYRLVEDLMGGEMGKKSGDDLLWSFVDSFQDLGEDNHDIEIDSIVVYYRVGLKGYTLDVAVKEVQNLVDRLTPMLWAGQVKLVLTGNASAMSPVSEFETVALMPVNEALVTNVNEKTPLALIEVLPGQSSKKGADSPESLGFFSVGGTWWGQMLPGTSLKATSLNYMQKLAKVALWDPKTGELSKTDQPENLLGWVRERGRDVSILNPETPGIKDYDPSHLCPITTDNLGQIGTYVGCSTALLGTWGLSYVWNIFEYRPSYRTLEALGLSILAAKSARMGVVEVYDLIVEQWADHLQKVSPAEGDNLMVVLGEVYTPGEGFSEEVIARVEDAVRAVEAQIAQIAPSVVQ